MDVIGVYQAAVVAVDRARRGEGPTLLEFKTYRFMGHSRGDPGSYRSKQEIAEWREHDPIPRVRNILLTDFNLGEEPLVEIEAQAQAEVETAIQFAISSPDPAPEETLMNVFAGEGE
jgi:pyruvate dehydrogenase E1 component alpha subunit